MISPSDLKNILRYDPESGELFWLPREPVSNYVRSWNTRHAGKRALCTVTAYGHLKGIIYNQRFLAHRVAYAIYYGRWPQNYIDHINGIPSDNRIVNLRDVSQGENLRNQKRSITNTSGVTGVCWNAVVGKWMAQISSPKHKKYLGVFERFEDAVAARKSAERRLGFHPNHGRNQNLSEIGASQ